MVAKNVGLSFNPISCTMVFCDIVLSQSNLDSIFWLQPNKHFNPHWIWEICISMFLWKSLYVDKVQETYSWTLTKIFYLIFIIEILNLRKHTYSYYVLTAKVHNQKNNELNVFDNNYVIFTNINVIRILLLNSGVILFLALFMLETSSCLYLWQGWFPVETNTNVDMERGEDHATIVTTGKIFNFWMW